MTMQIRNESGSLKSVSVFRMRTLGAAGAALLFCVLSGRAGSNWDGGSTTTNGTSDAANWDGDALPGSGAAMTFGSVSPIGTTIVWDFASSKNPNSITFLAGAPGYTIKDNAAANVVQIVQGSGGGVYNNSSSTQTVNKIVHVFFNGVKQFNAASNNLVFGTDVGFRGDAMTSGQTNTLSLTGAKNGTISGAIVPVGPVAGVTFALSKDGAGTWTLNKDVTFTGPVTVNAGNLTITGTNRLATVTGITVNSGGQLWASANGSFTNRPMTMTGTGPNAWGGLVFNWNGATITWPGAITLGGASGIGAFSTGGSYTFSSGIGGTGGLTFWAGGNDPTQTQTFTLNGACTYSGNTTILATFNDNNTVQLGIDNGLPTGTSLTLNSAKWGSTNMVAQLKLNGKNQELAGLANTGVGVQRIVNGSAASSTLTLNTGTASTYSGSLGGTNANENNFALVKKGSGALALGGNNTYSGGTAISNGTLFVNGRITGPVTVSGGTLAGSGTVTGAVAVASGGISAGGSAASAGTLTIEGNLGLVSGSTAVFDLAGTAIPGGGVNDLIQLSGTARDLTLNSNPVTINPLAPLAAGTPYTLITFTGTRSGDLGTVSVSGGGRIPVTVTYDDTPGAGKVMVTFGAAPGLIWNSVSSSVWDVQTSFNWLNMGAPDVFFQSDNVTFDDTPGVQTAVTLSTTVLPTTVTVNSSANAFSLSGTGKISGGAILTKDGSSTFTVSNTNDYTGATTINGGVLDFAGSSSVPNASAIALNGGSVRFSGGGTRGGLISGVGNLVKAGANTLTLSGNNSYAGVTTLAAGTLSLAVLANGGANSPIGAASSAASNLVFNGGALSYSGSTSSSDRGFTLAYGTNIITVTDAAATLTLTGGCPTNTVFLEKAGAGTLVLDPGAASVYSLGSLAAYGGTLTLKSGTITTSRPDPILGYANSVGARYNGKLVVDGATLNAANGYRITIGAAESGTLDIRSGTVNAGWLILGHNGTVASTQGGGSVNVSDLFHYDGGTATHSMTGGVLTVRRIYNWTKGAGCTFTLNLNGGLIVAASGTANLIDHNSQTNLPALEVAVKLGAVGATIDTSLSSATIVRPLDNLPGQAGRLTKIGTGTLTLTATNTYSGATVVSNGFLRLTHTQVLAVSNEVHIAAGAKINLDFEGVQTIRRLYINGELMTVNMPYGESNRPASLSGTGYLLATEGPKPKGTLMRVM